MSAASNFMNMFFPGVGQRRRDSMIENQARRNLEALMPFTQGQQVQQPFEFDSFGPEDPLNQLQAQGTNRLTDNVQLPGLINQQQAGALAGVLANPQTQGFGNAILSRITGTSPRDNRPSSVREFEYFNALPNDKKRKEFMNLKRQGYQLTDIAGVQSLVSTNDPNQNPIPLSSIDAEAAAKSDLAKASKLGQGAGAQANKSITQLAPITKNISNLRRVIELVGDGAETGPISDMFPSFKQSSIELQNVANNLGLDVLGSVTFGSLSAEELKLALRTGLPTNLNGPGLVKWANEKITAQEKLKTYLEDQAIFLSESGNTQADWLELQRDSKPAKRNKVYNPQTGRIE